MKSYIDATRLADVEPPFDPFVDETFRVPVPDVPPMSVGTGTGTSGVPEVPGTFPDDVDDKTGLFFDVAAMMAGGAPARPRPRWVHRTDGMALFYAGQVNLVFGDPESGKSWLVLCGLAESLADGGRAVVIDLDHNGPEATVQRLLDLRVDADVLSDPDRFRYVEPDDAAHLLAVIRACVAWRPDVAMVDSVGELLPIFGYSSNSPDDFTAAHAKVLKPLARAGACVVAVDHLAKNRESREQGPTGTAAKARAVGGSSIRVEVVDAFAPGRGGKARLTLRKDRHGSLRAACPSERGEPYAGLFRLEALDGGKLRWFVYSPEEAPESAARPTEGPTSRGAMTVAEALDKLDELPEADRPRATVKAIQQALGCSNSLASDVAKALRERPVPVPVPEHIGGTSGTGTGTPAREAGR